MDIRSAYDSSFLKEDYIYLVYQPIVDAHRHDIYAYEVLLRVREAYQDQLFSLSNLIAYAEKNNFIYDLDSYVLGRVLALLNKESGLFPPFSFLSVNVSAQTLSKKEYIQQYVASLRRYAHLAPRLILELTETRPLKDKSLLMDFIEEIRTLGCRFSIDDFGAGHTDFEDLTFIKPDQVKIDGQYIEKFRSSPSHKNFIRETIALTRSFGAETVAEWVSSEEEAKGLADLGVDKLQGFFFGGPDTKPLYP